MTDLYHLTLETRHQRRSPRAEVDDRVVAMLRRMVPAGGPIPVFPEIALDFSGLRSPRDGQVNIWTDGLAAPLVRCWLGADDPEAVWRLVRKQPEGAWLGPDAPAPPFLAVSPNLMAMIEPSAAELPIAKRAGSQGEVLLMMGDLERCVAWALIEAGRPVPS